jgi:hypothetical protein
MRRPWSFGVAVRPHIEGIRYALRAARDPAKLRSEFVPADGDEDDWMAVVNADGRRQLVPLSFPWTAPAW